MKKRMVCSALRKLLPLLIILSSSLLFGQSTAVDQVFQKLDTVRISTNDSFQLKEFGFHHQKAFLHRLFNPQPVANFQSDNYIQQYDSPAVYIKCPKGKQKIFINSIFLRIRSISEPIKVKIYLYSFNKEKHKIRKKIFEKEVLINHSYRLKEIILGKQIEFPKSGVLVQVESLENGAFILKMKKTRHDELSSSYFLSKDHKVHMMFSKDALPNNFNFMIGLSAYLPK